jgi:hypothetical protein
LWVPCPPTVISPHEGTHKGCPYEQLSLLIIEHL